jgi:N-acetylglucosamine kinase-like BadF-type ATPase
MSDLLLAVDGGNSKTDVLVLTDEGEVLGSVRGRTCAPFHLGLAGAMDCLDELIAETLRVAGRSTGSIPLRAGVFALAGADLPHEEAELLAAVSGRHWVRDAAVHNDAFALLRAGTDRPWGVAVVCGAGINCVGVGPHGDVARFPALGGISGDWGGGHDVGLAGLGAAVRAVDGRGPATALTETVSAYFGLPDPVAVMTAMHVGELDERRVLELPPTVFAAAASGDAVAGQIVLRLAGEVVACAVAAIRRLGLQDSDPDVVLGGSLLRAGLPLLDDAVRSGVLAVAPGAVVSHVAVAPVVGAASLVLEGVGASDQSHERVRRWGLTHDDRTAAAAVDQSPQIS